MRCFLACFRFPVKRRRKRKSVSSPDHARCSYRPLTSFLEENGGGIGVVSDTRGGQSSLTRKKVRFDLNMQEYEPLPPEDSCSIESDVDEFIEKKHCEETTLMVTSTGGSALASKDRYRNCRDSSDEKDLSPYDDDDLAFEQDEDEYFGDDETWGSDSHRLEWRSLKDGVTVHSGSVSASSEKQKVLPKAAEDNKDNNMLYIAASIRPSKNARFMNHSVHSVLDPVENTVQWKTIKAKAKLSSRKRNKESRELEGELLLRSKLSKTSEKAEKIL